MLIVRMQFSRQLVDATDAHNISTTRSLHCLDGFLIRSERVKRQRPLGNRP
jgi:hypothetical protein